VPDARSATLDLAKSTPCGRFTVTIESFPQGDVVAVKDAVRSLVDLSQILMEAAEVAQQLAQKLLEKEQEGQCPTTKM
jgi:hypothetical protein